MTSKQNDSCNTSMKLYRVVLRGMTHNFAGGTTYGISYVVASDPTLAVKQVQDYLTNHKIGFHEDRELDRMELLAECSPYPACKTMLFLQDGPHVK